MIKWPTHEEFKTIAREFELRWNYPMAVGAIDGSHIRIKVPRDEKTSYYDYKQDYSMTLLAICDANYVFYSCFCGMSGRNHDSKVFKTSNAYVALSQQQSLPVTERVINGTAIPFHVLGDSAFAEATWLITTFKYRSASTATAEQQQQQQDQTTFNYRHSR